MRIGPLIPIERGYFYKINSGIDIRLVRFTLEDNGLVEF